jgi:hypothetical protein
MAKNQPKSIKTMGYSPCKMAKNEPKSIKTMGYNPSKWPKMNQNR